MNDKKEIIISLRNKRYTFQRIGDILGISRQRVHQILYNNQRKNPKPEKKIVLKDISHYRQINGVYNSKGLGNLSGTDFLAELVRKRDNWTCQICGKVWKKGQRRFDVHHIDEKDENKHTYANYKKFDRMITLCHKCHLNLEHIRKKMSKKHSKS